MSGYEQNAVSKVVWPWPTDAANAKPAGMARPMKALVQVVIMAIIGGVMVWADKIIMSRIVFSIAAVVLLSGLFVPPVFDAIERFGKALGRYLATGMTWLLLVPFFYICFAPARFILKLRGKDPLNRSCPTDQPTYWIKRAPVDNVNHYRRQY